MVYKIEKYQWGGLVESSEDTKVMWRLRSRKARTGDIENEAEVREKLRTGIEGLR